MIHPEDFIDLLSAEGINFYTGVPDSLLKHFCQSLDDRNIGHRTVNEGTAIALGAGHYLASGTIPFIYLQNSGLGNSVNPLVSLADPGVYGIPMILMIGWRGEPGIRDEPQHLKQGDITPPILDTLGIPFLELDQNPKTTAKQIEQAIRSVRTRSGPFAFLVRKNTFSPGPKKTAESNVYGWTREEAISILADQAKSSDLFVSTTGKASRELFEYRKNSRQSHASDFLTVGSMGHASSIALGIAQQLPKRRIICIDGDGALLMHLGALAAIGASKQANFHHVLINNHCHDSVGGQSTFSPDIDVVTIARGCGYQNVWSFDSKAEYSAFLTKEPEIAGPSFVELKVDRGSRNNLSRPSASPVENKTKFMENCLSNTL